MSSIDPSSSELEMTRSEDSSHHRHVQVGDSAVAPPAPFDGALFKNRGGVPKVTVVPSALQCIDSALRLLWICFTIFFNVNRAVK